MSCPKPIHRLQRGADVLNPRHADVQYTLYFVSNRKPEAAAHEMETPRQRDASLSHNQHGVEAWIKWISRQHGAFIRGPIPLAWLAGVLKLPGPRSAGGGAGQVGGSPSGATGAEMVQNKTGQSRTERDTQSKPAERKPSFFIKKPIEKATPGINQGGVSVLPVGLEPTTYGLRVPQKGSNGVQSK